MFVIPGVFTKINDYQVIIHLISFLLKIVNRNRKVTATKIWGTRTHLHNIITFCCRSLGSFSFFTSVLAGANSL